MALTNAERQRRFRERRRAAVPVVQRPERPAGRPKPRPAVRFVERGAAAPARRRPRPVHGRREPGDGGVSLSPKMVGRLLRFQAAGPLTGKGERCLGTAAPHSSASLGPITGVRLTSQGQKTPVFPGAFRRTTSLSRWGFAPESARIDSGAARSGCHSVAR